MYLTTMYIYYAPHSKPEVLLGYGASADRRWRDLLTVAVAEDTIIAANLGTMCI